MQEKVGLTMAQADRGAGKLRVNFQKGSQVFRGVFGGGREPGQVTRFANHMTGNWDGVW